jgi:DNA-binding CsgD family transcriptional regulator
MARLTGAELEVLRQLAYGLTLEDIAYRRGVSRSTIRNQLTSAYAKLDVGNGIQAFVELGWLRVPGTPIELAPGTDAL